MPLGIDAGDPTTGLRRAFGITGRIPLALDETVVPVAVIRDSSKPPFAVNPARCWGTTISVGTVATAPASMLFNRVGTGIVAVVNRVVISTPGFAAAKRITFVLGRNGTVGTIGNTAAPSPGVVVANDDNVNQISNQPGKPLCTLYGDPQAAALGVTFFQAWWAPSGTVNQPRVFDFPSGVVLYEGSVLQVNDGLGVDNAVEMDATWQWDEYQIVRP